MAPDDPEPILPPITPMARLAALVFAALVLTAFAAFRLHLVPFPGR